MVRGWHLLILLLATGCNAPAAVDHASIIADIAVRYAAIVCRQIDAPEQPTDGCVSGCGCNGTGKEKSGDGLAVVNCRCDDDCECKPSEPPRADPPVVPIKKPSTGRIECRNGTCYWVDDATGQRYRVVQ